MSHQTSRLREILAKAFYVAIGLVGAYVVYYWILWRGGKYVYLEFLEPLLTGPTSTATDASHSVLWLDVFKLLWAVLGTTLGGIAASIVRRWYVFGALEGKVELLEKVRLETMKLICEDSSKNFVEIAVSAGSIKYLFGEKEYINIGKYIHADVAMMMLRTISALDTLAAASKSKDFATELPRISESIAHELQQFNLGTVRQSLKVLRSDSAGATSDAAEKLVS